MDVKMRGANEINRASIKTCHRPSEPIKYF